MQRSDDSGGKTKSAGNLRRFISVGFVGSELVADSDAGIAEAVVLVAQIRIRGMLDRRKHTPVLGDVVTEPGRLMEVEAAADDWALARVVEARIGHRSAEAEIDEEFFAERHRPCEAGIS